MSIRGGYNTPQGDFDYEPPEDPLGFEIQQLKITHEDLQKEHDTLNASHAAVLETLEAAQARVAELEAQLADVTEKAKLWRGSFDGCDETKKRMRGNFAEMRQSIEAALREFQP